MDKKAVGKLIFLAGIVIAFIIAVVSVIKQSYKNHYNTGNKYYELGAYEDAIEEYQKALGWLTPSDMECDIRVNLALAMLDRDGILTDEPLQVTDDIAETLNECRDILMEDGCADDENTGHDADAQQLKNDIDELLNSAEQEDDEGDSDDNQDNQDDQSGSQEQDDELADKEKELQKNQDDAVSDREESSQLAKDVDNFSNSSTFYDGAVW